MKTQKCQEFGCGEYPYIRLRHPIVKTPKYFCEKHNPQKKGRYKEWKAEILKGF
jgi:hypothetical protein